MNAKLRVYSVGDFNVKSHIKGNCTDWDSIVYN